MANLLMPFRASSYLAKIICRIAMFQQDFVANRKNRSKTLLSNVISLFYWKIEDAAKNTVVPDTPHFQNAIQRHSNRKAYDEFLSSFQALSKLLITVQVVRCNRKRAPNFMTWFLSSQSLGFASATF